jgi:beta-glucosidase
MNHHKKIVASLAVLAAALTPGLTQSSAASPRVTAATANQTPEEQAAALVKRMTLQEKLTQLTNVSPAIPRLGIPAYSWWSEALHGVNSDIETTEFPEPIGLAATFDDNLLRADASAISEEARAVHELHREVAGGPPMGGGLDMWAPNINIFRDPRWGRGQETYGEDPFLTAQMGAAYVEGMQGPNPARPNVIATPKHFAVHSGPEPTRHTADVKVSLHDEEDTYLPAFRAAIVDGKAGSIMCAYNSVNGQPACANDFLLKTELRGAWGFQGYVVSDCDAEKDIANGHKYAPSLPAAVADAIKDGVDNECTVDGFIGVDTAKRYGDAVAQGLLTEADIDRALTRLFAARIKVGDITPDGHAIVLNTKPQVMTEAHRALDLRTAEESMVLLKNTGVLPLQSTVKKIVVTGPLADNIRVLRGNYSSAKMDGPVSVLAGLKAEFPNAEIRYVPAAQSIVDGEPIPESMLRTPDGKPGVKAEYFGMKTDPAHPQSIVGMLTGGTFEDKPFQSTIVPTVDVDSTSSCLGCKAVYSGVLVAPETGTYRVGVQGMLGTLKFEGKTISIGAMGSPLASMQSFHLEKGQSYPFSLEVIKAIGFGAQFVWQPISDDEAAALQAAASDADVVVAVVGLTSDLEGEESPVHLPGFSGGDRTTLDLPAEEQQLLQDAKATGKKLVVVNMSGSAVNLSWEKDNADALIQAWYPGDEGGTAVAKVLAGTFNPAGRLPVTFYKSVADLPSFDDYSMTNRTYRYYTGTPVYPFGYGLSYSTFSYGPVKVTHNGAGVTVQTSVTNTGKVDGDEVAQLYLNFPNQPGVPHIALRGFQRVHLVAGETTPLTYHLDARDLSSVTSAGVRKVVAGHYKVSVGGGQPNTGAPVAYADFNLAHTVKVAE